MARRDHFDQVSAPAMARIGAVMMDTLAQAGHPQIGTIFLTGGSAQMPSLRAMVRHNLPDVTIATGDMLGSVGTGLALQARRLFA